MLIFRHLKCPFTFTKVDEKLFYKIRHYRVKNNWYSHKSVNNPPWKVLFFGSDVFALKSLQKLQDLFKQQKLICRLEVVTAYKGTENALSKFAKENKISMHSWPPEISDKEFDIGIVVSFGHLIPARIIRLFPLGMINVHASLLPKWRGAAPISHALMNGDTCTGVSIMKIMPKKFDIGSVISQQEISIGPDETYTDLHNKLSELGANELIKVMDKLPYILHSAKPQCEDRITYAPKITPETAFIKWNEMSANTVYNLQRALTGISHLKAHLNNQVVKLINIKAIPKGVDVKCAQATVPGQSIYDKRKKILYISCQGNSWISVETVIIPGRKPQSAVDFGSGFILSQKNKLCIFY